MDDFQGSGVAGSENKVQKIKNNGFHFPIIFKTHNKNPAEKVQLSELAGRHLCRWGPVFLLYTWKQREPLGLPGYLTASLKSVALRLLFYVHSFVVAPL